MRKRSFLIVVVLLVTSAACNGDGEGGNGEQTDLRVQVSGEPEETAVYGAVVNAFEKDHPSIDVNLVEVADKDDHLTRLTSSFAGGDPPDVFLVNYREYSQFVTRGGVEPIGPFLDDAGVDLDAYYPQPVEAFTYDGTLQCMPQNISSLVVYYNRALFKDAGMPRPPESWNWDEFRTTALALTEGDVDGLGIEPNIIRIAPFVWSNGGEIVNDLESPSRFTLDEPVAREALEFVVSLVREDQVVPTATEIEAQDLETRFATGKLAMLLSSRRDTPVFREVARLDWDVAPLPVRDEPAGILHSDAYCMAAPSDEHSAAFEFIAFATGTAGQTITSLGGRTVPSLEKVATSGAFLDPTQPPRHSRVFLDGIPHIRRTPVLATWPEIEDLSEQVLTDLFYLDGYTIDDALSDLDEVTAPLFEEGADI